MSDSIPLAWPRHCQDAASCAEHCPHQGRVIANEIDTEVARLSDALDRFSQKMDEIIRERENRRDPRDTEITQLRTQVANLHAYNEGRDKMLADMTAEVDRLRTENAALRIDPTNPALRNAVAEVICNREFGAAEGRWERTIRFADEGAGFSYATLIRLISTAHFVLEAVVRALEVRTGKLMESENV